MMWSGSELIVLEIGEALRYWGWEVHVLANLITQPLGDAFIASGLHMGIDPSAVPAFDFDLVWIQHHMAPLLDYRHTDRARENTRFAFIHLSPFVDLERPGAVVEPLLADVVLFNSEETEVALVDADLAMLPRARFRNPAPDGFLDVRRDRQLEAPLRIAAISNHLPPEMDAALARLQEGHGVEVERIGFPGARHERVTPALLAGFDLVVTIGKSVQYAFAAGVPVFCYDRFGGPGYLSAETFDAAEAKNFSGRCHPYPRDVSCLSQEILDGYHRGLAFASRELPERFRLGYELDQLLRHPVRANAEKRRRLEKSAAAVQREAAGARVIRDFARSQYLPFPHYAPPA